MKLFGLIGKSLSHSFSAKYFNDKFDELQLKSHFYLNIELDHINEFPSAIDHLSGLEGLNVTIPYKTAIIPFLDFIDPDAKEINAVNTVKIDSKGLTGYNTDWIGFTQSLPAELKTHSKNTLILGSGGASNAIVFALNQLKHNVSLVSSSKKNLLSYEDVADLSDYDLIVNTTPLGMYPNIDVAPVLPYETLTGDEVLYDLVYNPPVTQFIAKGERHGCKTINGLGMLKKQAEASWGIWQK